MRSAIYLSFEPITISTLDAIADALPDHAVFDPDVARMTGATIAMGTPEAIDALRARLEGGLIQAAQEEAPTLSKAASRWLAIGERGTSSNAIFSHLTGFDATGSGGFDTPYDITDFRRCRLLLEQVPELAPLLDAMRSVSPAWACLIDAWPELCATMDAECPEWRAKKGLAPRTYELIQKAIGR